MMRWTLVVMSSVAAVGALAFFLVLRSQQHAGPPHRDVVLSGEVPATLYLPSAAAGTAPPVVVVGHGYSADRVTMSWFARTLASTGYAVLTFDFEGHGANVNPLEGDLVEDVDSALDWLGTSADVDADRVAVMGHSMGSHAVLQFASRDSRPGAVIALGSGVTELEGSRRPRNLLLLLGEREPADLQEATRNLFAELVGAPAVPGRIYGDVDQGDAVQFLRIASTDHVTVLWSRELVTETAEWLDAVFPGARSAQSITSDPRLGSIALYLSCVALLIPALGWAAGSVAPVRRKDTTRGTWSPLVAVAFSLLVALLVLLIVPTPPFFIRGFGEVVVYLFVAAATLLTIRILTQQGAMRERLIAAVGVEAEEGRGRLVLASALALAVGGLLLAPITLVFHRLVLSPQRLLIGGAMALLMLPFFVPFQVVLRQGPTIAAILRSGVGHLVLTAALGAAVLAGVLPGVVGLVLPLLLLVFVVTEVFGAAAYARSGNAALVGLIEAIGLAGLSAAVMPIS